MSSTDTSGIHVDANQALLLKAILSPGPEALEHYRRWAGSVDFDSLDGGSFRLMPMLYRRLAPLGLSGERYEKIKGIYRYTLSKNSIVLARFRGLAKALHEAGIRVMLLKGGALILKYYHDTGVRPMNDIDILIEEKDREQALEILGRLGWRDSMQRNYDQSLEIYPTVTLVSDQGFELDVHWNLLTEYGSGMPAHEWWRDAIVLDDRGGPLHVLGAEDQVIHNCAHGVKWNALSPIRWIPDVLAVLNAEDDLSWEALVQKCGERRVTLPVRTCLRYIREEFGAPVPDHVLEGLFARDVSDEEKRVYAAHTAPLTFSQRVIRQWRLFRIAYPERSWPLKILTFLGFLKKKSGIESYRGCFLYLCSLAYRSVVPAREARGRGRSS